MTLTPDGSAYAATFIPALRAEETPVRVSVRFTDNTEATVEATIVVRAPGRVLEKPLGMNPVPVADASVALYERRGNAWVLWDATPSGQRNPARSRRDGSYYFFVPNGRYLLRVNKEGYRESTLELTVTQNVIAETILLQPLPKPLATIIDPEKPLLENARVVLEEIQTRVQTPENQAAVRTVVVPAVAAIALSNVGTAISFFNLFNYLRFLFLQPILLLARRKRRKWGIVYNSLSKRPIDLAIVRLIHAQTNLVVQTRITDAKGRYSILARPGSYRLEVVKPGYVFPSELLKSEKVDIEFVDLYHGETLEVKEPSMLTPNIPLDPSAEEETPHRVVIKMVLRKVQNVAGISSVALSFISVVVVPTLVMASFAILQLLVYLLFRRLALPPKLKSWGIIYDETTKQNLDRVVVRIFDKKFNKLLETQVTDGSGKYGFIVGKNIYYVVAERPGYARYVSPDLDTTKKEIVVIDEKISLKKQQ
jgi:hypothetical protein